MRTPSRACSTVGTASTNASHCSTSASTCSKTRAPCSPATAAATSGRSSCTPTSRTPGSEDRMRTWCRPSAPVPTTPIGSPPALSTCVDGSATASGNNTGATGSAAATRALLPGQRADDAALRAGDEVEQVGDLGIVAVLGAHALEPFGERHLAAQQQAHRRLEAADRFLGEALALEADAVDA